MVTDRGALLGLLLEMALVPRCPDRRAGAKLVTARANARVALAAENHRAEVIVFRCVVHTS